MSLLLKYQLFFDRQNFIIKIGKMNIVIVEDEIYTAKNLAKSIKELIDSANVLKIIDSVEDAIDFFNTKPDIDLIFMDIQLSDGISFDIFKSVEIEAPIIFTTSFNEYAIKAFEVNSIDYLLKPIEQKMLERSLQKFQKQYDKANAKLNFEALIKVMNRQNVEYKSRFMVKTATGLLAILTADIAYFYIDNQIVYLKTKAGKQHHLEIKLDDIENSLDPKLFFRLNRQCIVHIEAIHKIHNFWNNTLKIELQPAIDLEVVVSRYTIKDFKKWLDS